MGPLGLHARGIPRGEAPRGVISSEVCSYCNFAFAMRSCRCRQVFLARNSGATRGGRPSGLPWPHGSPGVAVPKVQYCDALCQRRDWPTHLPSCAYLVRIAAIIRVLVDPLPEDRKGVTTTPPGASPKGCAPPGARASKPRAPGGARSGGDAPGVVYL